MSPEAGLSPAEPMRINDFFSFSIKVCKLSVATVHLEPTLNQLPAFLLQRKTNEENSPDTMDLTLLFC